MHQTIKHKYRGVDTAYGETPDGAKYVVVRKRKGKCVCVCVFSRLKFMFFVCCYCLGVFVLGCFVLYDDY